MFTLIGLWLVNYGDETIGTTLVIASCTYMLLASLFMGAADLLGYWRHGQLGNMQASKTRPSPSWLIGSAVISPD